MKGIKIAAQKKKIDWFLPGMVLAVFLAWLFPEPGADGGWMQPELLTNIGVALIFFLHGLNLSFASLRSGMLQWKLHLLVQGGVFLIFPVMGITLYFATETLLPADLRLGFFFLTALPSTVSSSVAMTSAARGNVPAAVFNATISSLIGVVLTPLWMSIATETGGSQTPLAGVILKLCLWLVLPLVVGQCLRPWLGEWAKRNKRLINTVDRSTILLMVYTSFCDSFVMGIWTRYGLSAVFSSMGITFILFWCIFLILAQLCRWMHLNREDRIAAIFCGSKKSLATGVPMAQLMFGSHPGLGLILLPMLIYHPMQLFICGFLASRWASDDHLLPSETGVLNGSPPLNPKVDVPSSQSVT